MQKVWPGILFLFLLASCHDVKKQRQLDRLAALDTTADSIGRAWEAAQTDSINEILSEVREVEQQIRDNYRSDTISLEFSQQLEDYKMISKGLSAFAGNAEKIDFGIKQVRLSIGELRHDIEEAAGDRSKYDEYIAHEKNKVDRLSVLLRNSVETKRNCLLSYQRLHASIREFSEKK